MLTVKYPAKTSLFVNEDAIIRQYGFWDLLKCALTRQCHPYHIVYTDGLISPVISDSEDRDVYGILFGSYIFPLHAPKTEMTVGKAIIYCQKVVFANRKATLPSIDVLRYIRSDKERINQMFKSLGGDIFQEGSYITDSNRGINEHIGVNFANFAFFQCIIDRENDEEAFCRPVIDISDIY